METHDVDNEIMLATLDFDALGKDRLSAEKLSALMTLHGIAGTYRREHFPEETIIRPIILKKIEFIKVAESGKQLREILAPTRVRYSGGEIRPVGPYAIPEEELAIWSRTSVMAGAPLIAPAAKRYRELFKQVFPKLAEEFGI